MIRRGLLRQGVVVLLVAAFAAPALAQDGPQIEVVAEGLNNPRGIAIAPDGTVYVAEAGTAGDQCMEGGPAGQVCFGPTGSVSRITDGSVERIIEGLPSAGFGAEVGGPSDIAFIDDSTFYVVENLGADPAEREQMPPEMAGVAGWLLRGTTDGTIEPFADVAAIEASENPDQSAVDSNPHSVAVVDGGALVADAGGNDLLMVDESGNVSVVAVFPAQEVLFSAAELQALGAPPPGEGGPPPAESPATGAEGEGMAAESPAAEGEAMGSPGADQMVPVPVESVPTSVVVGPDDAYYVGELTGGPFPAGEASVYRVTPEGEVSEYATGFTNIIDIAFGPDGTLYVAEIVTEGLMSVFAGGQAPIGAVKSVPPGGGEPSLLATGEQFIAPGGLAATEDSLYVSVGNLSPGSPGSLLRIPLSQ